MECDIGPRGGRRRPRLWCSSTGTGICKRERDESGSVIRNTGIQSKRENYNILSCPQFKSWTQKPTTWPGTINYTNPHCKIPWQLKSHLSVDNNNRCRTIHKFTFLLPLINQSKPPSPPPGRTCTKTLAVNSRWATNRQSSHHTLRATPIAIPRFRRQIEVHSSDPMMTIIIITHSSTNDRSIKAPLEHPLRVICRRYHSTRHCYHLF